MFSSSTHRVITVSYTHLFILIHKDQKKPEQGTEVLKFFDWAYKTGAKQANDLDYASLPDLSLIHISK